MKDQERDESRRLLSMLLTQGRKLLQPSLIAATEKLVEQLSKEPFAVVIIGDLRFLPTDLSLTSYRDGRVRLDVSGIDIAPLLGRVGIAEQLSLRWGDAIHEGAGRLDVVSWGGFRWVGKLSKATAKTAEPPAACPAESQAERDPQRGE